MVTRSKRSKILKVGAIVIAVIFLNPLALYVYLIAFLNYRQNRSDQPKIENNFSIVQIPAECNMISKRTVAGGIDSSANIHVVYKCDTQAQVVYSKLATTYKTKLVNMPNGNPALSARPYVFNFFISEVAADSDDAPKQKDVASPTTNPVFLGVSIFPE